MKLTLEEVLNEVECVRFALYSTSKSKVREGQLAVLDNLVQRFEDVAKNKKLSK